MLEHACTDETLQGIPLRILPTLAARLAYLYLVLSNIYVYVEDH